MKLFLSTFLFLLSLNSFSQKSYTLKPDAQGYLIIDNKAGIYKPGDTIMLDGYFKAVAVQNLSGSAISSTGPGLDPLSIKITNVPGKTLIIGDSTWPGGSWGHGLAIRNSHHLKVFGTTKSNFKITGSNSTKLDANGYPVKTAYMDLMITEMSDNITVHDVAIRHGGLGILTKTDTYGTVVLYNFEFYNIDVYNTYNEAFYIGHTTSTPNSAGQFPYKLDHVKVHHNYVHDIGNDGIQIAAADNVEVYNNEVYNWGTKKEYSHSGGICMGSRMTGFNVHDNYVHDGFGNMLQVFSNGGGLAVIKNNLFVRNKLDGVIVRAASPLTLSFINNTVAYAGENLVRISGANSKIDLNKNILAGPLGGSYTGTLYLKNFIYTENGGSYIDNDNKTFALASQVGWLETNYYQPLATSTAVGYGYVVAVKPPDPEPQPATGLKLSITLPQISLDKLTEGSHVLKLTLPDGKVAFITIVVQK